MPQKETAEKTKKEKKIRLFGWKKPVAEAVTTEANLFETQFWNSFETWSSGCRFNL
jgi:hypothetical protein